jgi:hypothetical protein
MPAKKKLKYEWDLEDFVGEALLTAKKLPVGRPETPAEKGLGTSWGVGPVGQTRDSDLLEVSNFEAVSTDLLERFGEDDVEILRFGHFVVGWVDEIAWRAVDKKGLITKVAQAAYEWFSKLEEHPVADEEDYSRRESEVQWENVKSALGDFYNRYEGEIEGRFFYVWDENEKSREKLISDVYGLLSDRDRAGDEHRSVKEKDLEEALRELGLLAEIPEGANSN